MYKWEKPLKEDRYKRKRKNPSFASIILDEIDRSICEADNTKHEDLKFYRESMPKKHNKVVGVKSCRPIEQDEEIATFRHACLIVKKRMDHKVNQKASAARQNFKEFERKSQLNTESIYGAMAKGGFLPPTRPKPVRTSVSAKSGKTERATFYEQSELYPRLEDSKMKSKSKALKIYSKVKRSILPGGKLPNFFNSLFTI